MIPSVVRGLPSALHTRTGSLDTGFPLAVGYADPVLLFRGGAWYFLATNDNVNDIGLFVRRPAYPHRFLPAGSIRNLPALLQPHHVALWRPLLSAHGKKNVQHSADLMKFRRPEGLVLLSRPLYGWENTSGTINNEGPYALILGDTVYLAYSGAARRIFAYSIVKVSSTFRSASATSLSPATFNSADSCSVYPDFAKASIQRVSGGQADVLYSDSRTLSQLEHLSVLPASPIPE